MDKTLFSCGVFIEIQKAFDIVDHEILLQKLNYYGFRGTVVSRQVVFTVSLTAFNACIRNSILGPKNDFTRSSFNDWYPVLRTTHLVLLPLPLSESKRFVREIQTLIEITILILADGSSTTLIPYSETNHSISSPRNSKTGQSNPRGNPSSHGTTEGSSPKSDNEAGNLVNLFNKLN